MSSASVTNNFVNGLVADADQVDQNFTDLASFLNSHVAHIHQLGQGSQVLSFKPGAATDTSGTPASFTNWFSAGNLTVPSWATKVRVQIGFNAYLLASAAIKTIDVRTKIGGTAGAGEWRISLQDITDIDRHNASWADEIAVSPGAQAVNFEYKHLAGGGQVRVDTGSLITVMAHFSE